MSHRSGGGGDCQTKAKNPLFAIWVGTRVPGLAQLEMTKYAGIVGLVTDAMACRTLSVNESCSPVQADTIVSL